MKLIKWILVSFFISGIANAASIDDLIAKTSLALGDEYMKSAQVLEKDVVSITKNANINFEDRLSLNYPVIQEYEDLRNLAVLEYRNVLCTSFCPEGLGNLKLSAESVFYRREAYSKIEIMSNGGLTSGVLLKRATIYAAKGEFEEHLLGRLYKLVSSQQSFDSTARTLNKQLLDLQSAYVNEAGQVIGIDQAIFRDSNYQLSQQTQYQGYKSCVDSYKSQDQFETAEYKKSLDQYELLKNNLINNLSKVYNFTYSTPAGDKAFKISANTSWQNTNVLFDAGDKVALIANGKWAARSAARVFKDSDLVRYTASTIAPRGLFKAVKKIFSAVASTGVLGLLPALMADQAKDVEAKVLQEVKESSANIVNRIATASFDAGPEGYYYSFSNSLSKSVNLSKVYNFTYSTPAGDKAFKISANTSWQNTNVLFDAGDKVALIANGKWAARSAARVFKDSDLVRYTASTIAPRGLFKAVKKIFSAVASTGVLGLLPALMADQAKDVEAKVLQEVKESSANIVNRIATASFDAGPEGYYYSFSNSLSKSVNQGESSSVGLGASFMGLGVNTSSGTSAGDSSSSSAGTGGTYALKLYTALMPEAPVGALIGSFCGHNPSLGGCTYFEIGTGGAFSVEAPVSEGSTLWVRINDKVDGLSYNTGSLNLEVKKSTAFKDYLDQYYTWMDQSCDENGENCGLNNILENIAYTSNPTEVISSMFTKKFPDFPAEVKVILMAELNYIIQMNIIQKDLKNKEHSQELNDVKVTYCKEQVKLTEDSVKTTAELIKTYSNMTDNALSKRLLLDTAKQFYERELENLNWIRGKNLERIERYYNLAVNSFNYLYFADYQPVGSLLPYNEGDYYLENIERMKDQIIDITTVNDLLNPNRGFVVYELSSDELSSLQSANFRNRKAQFRVQLEDVMCSGFGLDNQTRVMIDKVGVLLDLDPAREHLFFTNPHVKNAKPLVSHSSENRFYDLQGLETEYWMPSQKRNINAWSTQVLADANSDYQELRDTRYFDRLSFRKTSFASTWNIELNDPTLKMYTSGNLEPILRGVKFVFWFNSTESQGERPVNSCATPPMSFVEKSYDDINRKVTLEWELDKAEAALFNTSHFTIYQAGNEKNGYRLKDQVSLSSCTDLGEFYKCEREIDLSSLPVAAKSYFKIRAAYKKENQEKLYSGYYSDSLEVVAN